MDEALPPLDGLVELLAARGTLSAQEAACRLLRADVPAGLAPALLAPLVRDDARLRWRGGLVELAERPSAPLERARFVVVDLETTGLRLAASEIVEIGAVRVERLALGARFETRVRTRHPAADAGGAPSLERALRRFAAFAGRRVLVAHNARFDRGFLDAALAELSGTRLAGPVLDTLPLARRLLAGRTAHLNLAALAAFFGTASAPCHRALPDAEATAEVFLHLVELARERGVASLEELVALAAQPISRRRDAASRLRA